MPARSRHPTLASRSITGKDRRDDVIQTAFTRLVGVQHPVVSAGMGSGFAPGELAGRVSEAGGLGVIGASWLSRDRVAELAAAARRITSNPIGINLLLFGNEELLDPVLAEQPAVLSTAWARVEQDLAAIFARAHERGALVMHMSATLEDALRATEAGADVIVAQGTEGGGHVGLMGSAVLVRQVAKALAPMPVLAAGGFADGAGLVAALALGAEGVLLGTRFVATDECPAPPEYKGRIVASDGHDTVLTTLAEALSGADWPGAWGRVARTRFVEEWIGREPELRRRREEVWRRLDEAEASGDGDYSRFWIGQSAGLIDAVLPAADIVAQVVAEAEEILRSRLPALTAPPDA
jgi:NAD(P)H-dependent flavin oxidoreductase YrpB (nitropropane dioxygenase family)